MELCDAAHENCMWQIKTRLDMVFLATMTNVGGLLSMQNWDSLNEMLSIRAGAHNMTRIFLRAFEEGLHALADATGTSVLQT